MRLGWSKKGISISYYIHKTIYVNRKNKSQVIKRLGAEKYICGIYGVSDVKAWVQEQVELMRRSELDDNIFLCVPVQICHWTNKDVLTYTRILFPSPKLSTFRDSHRFIEQPDFDLHQIYRALFVLADESENILGRLFRNSLQIAKGCAEVICYDCSQIIDTCRK